MNAAWTQIRSAIWPDLAEDEETVAAAPEMSLREIVRRFWPDARPFRRWLIPTLFIIALGPALETATIWLYKLLVDEVLVPQDLALFPQIALAYVALTLASGLVTFGDTYLSAWVSEHFLLNLRTRVLAHLQSLSPDFFDSRQRGDLVARLTDDADEIDALMVSGVANGLSYLLRILFFAGALFFLNWRLALLALLVAPLFWLAARIFSNRISRVARQQRRHAGAVSAIVEEGLVNLPLVQAYGLEASQGARFRRAAEASVAAQLAQTRTKAALTPLLDLLELGGVLIVVGAGTWALAQGSMTLGGLLIFLTYLTQLMSPVNGLSQLIGSIATSSASAERLIEVLDEPVAIAQEQGITALGDIRGEVEFSNVSFAYPGTDELVLEDIHFRVPPGGTLAIVGESGSGKSTLARLLLRFYEPTSGAIGLDGADLRQIAPHALRSQMAVVLQDSLVFAGTIRENIALGRPEATDAEIEAAARAADAHAFIQAMPDGYATEIGQGGAGLSGGQRQRVAIARALIRNAPILILDEPTSGLDVVSTERVMEPFQRLMSGRTTILISHNLLTVRDASEILVMDEGRIVERGTHHELLRRDGPYANLYWRQFPEQFIRSESVDLATVA